MISDVRVRSQGYIYVTFNVITKDLQKLGYNIRGVCVTTGEAAATTSDLLPPPENVVTMAALSNTMGNMSID